MKGLLIKDFRFILQNKKMLLALLFAVVAVLVMQGEEGASFIISYMTGICSMLVLNTIATDEFDKSSTFLMTMPISRGIYAAEKYVFAMICSLFGWGISTVFCVFLQSQNRMECLEMALILLVVFTFLEMIMLPIQLKFGGEKGRMVLVGIFAGLFAVIMLVKKISEYMFATQEEAQQWLNEMLIKLDNLNKTSSILIVAAVWLLSLGISFFVSKKIMENKEY